MMKVRICGIDHKVESNQQRLEDLGTIGYYDQRKALIGIDINSPKHIQKEVLIHEILESINAQLELELDHPKITAISASFNQVIEDNPHLFKNKFKGIE